MIHDIAQTGYAGSGAIPTRPEGPLTVEVLDALNRAQDVANEVRHRLYTLRDRLFGSPPETVSQSKNGADPSSFKAAHADRAELLNATLAEVDKLSADLANRL